jgi:Uma2 family endonuclease
MPDLIDGNMTPAEYLRFERASKEKHEYFRGKVTALAGASLNHNYIVANIMREVGNVLKRSPCMVLPGDIRIASPSGASYMYPDAVIVCGKPELEDDRFDTLKNPVVIFEVLSSSTKDHDRVKKFSYYRQIPSFREYVLIDSLSLFVEISIRQEGDTWKFESYSDPGGAVFIDSIRSHLSMEELYLHVF